MQHKKIFLASSSELVDERRDFEIAIYRKNKDWVRQGVFLELILWEDFLDTLSPTRLQDEYNRAIRHCDVFVLLFWRKVGRYTGEEFDTAVGQFQATRRPFIFTYFKDVEPPAATPRDASVAAFQARLTALGHFYTAYQNSEGLQLHFIRQLDKLVANGFITLQPPGDEAPIAGVTTYAATLGGNGASAQGERATAVGAGGIHIGGNNSGNHNTGTQIFNTGGGAWVGGDVTAGGNFIGRDYIQIIIDGLDSRQDADDAQATLSAYLQAMCRDLGTLRLGEIDGTGVDAADPRRKPLDLADLYVPLDTQLQIPHPLTLATYLASRQNHKTPAKHDETEHRPVSALEALSTHRQLTLLGAAGSGKSTFGAHVLLALAQTWRGHAGQIAQLGDSWTHGALLPLRIVLRRFADRLPAAGGPASAADLWSFVADEMAQAGFGEVADNRRHLQRIARRHGAFVVFDGLDECGSEDKRRRVLAGVRQFIASDAANRCRFLLTARPYAWRENPAAHDGEYLLAEFSEAQSEAFIRAWYAAIVRRGWYPAQEADKKCADLLAARQRPDLRELAANPLLLTLMASLHTNSAGGLPDDRAELYDAAVELLLRRWNSRIGADRALLDVLAVPGLKLADLRDVLEAEACALHAAHVGRAGTADLGEDRLNRAFRPLLADDRNKAAQIVDYIDRRAGLLVGQGGRTSDEKQYTFPHRTFQEFLAACHLAKQDDFAERCATLARQAPEHWQEVLPLAARRAGVHRGPAAANALVHGVEQANWPSPLTLADGHAALLAARQLQEIGLTALRASESNRAIIHRVAGWLAAVLPLHPSDHGLPARQRAQAGDLLARLGDPRFDAGRFHLPADEMLGFVRIPADPGFMIGTRPGDVRRIEEETGASVDGNEINEQRSPTEEFLIARYLVTVAQFRAFCQASDFRPADEDLWHDADNRPVRRVSWRAAVAYCRWLQAALGEAENIPHEIAEHLRQGWQVALPSELEWEKAARGGLTAKAYPWGDPPDPERANTAATGIGDTSAVGCFAANGYALHDMAGNVWQWTRSHWQDSYPYDRRNESTHADENSAMVVRGGSWGSPQGVARCAYRLVFHPDGRDDDIGFRVVLRSAPVP